MFNPPLMREPKRSEYKRGFIPPTETEAIKYMTRRLRVGSRVFIVTGPQRLLNKRWCIIRIEWIKVRHTRGTTICPLYRLVRPRDIDAGKNGQVAGLTAVPHFLQEEGFKGIIESSITFVQWHPKRTPKQPTEKPEPLVEKPAPTQYGSFLELQAAQRKAQRESQEESHDE